MSVAKGAEGVYLSEPCDTACSGSIMKSVRVDCCVANVASFARNGLCQSSSTECVFQRRRDAKRVK